MTNGQPGGMRAAAHQQGILSGTSHDLGARVTHVCAVLLLATFVTMLPVATHFVSPALAIGSQFILVSMVAIYYTRLAPLITLYSLIFQNLFVSFFSGYLTGTDDYNFVRGYNFLTVMITWLWIYGHYLINRHQYNAQTNRIMAVCFGLYCVIGFYFLLGFAKNPTGAVIYLRNVISHLVMFQTFYLVSQRYGQRIQDFFFALTLLIIVLGAIEAIDRKLWFDLTNGWTMWEFIQETKRINLIWDRDVDATGVVNVTSLLDTMKIAFLNTPLLGDLQLTVLRMRGPNVHAISYSYLLCFLSIIMIFTGRALWFVPMIPFILLASAKGALIMLFVACCGLLARKLFGAAFALASMIVVLLIYLVAGILVGLHIGDYHVIGFMGGIFDFLSNPLGRGLGDGGNLGADFGTLDWPAYQRAGRTPFAIESAVGVLLRQMGFATFILIAGYFWIAFQTFKVSLKSRVSLHTVLSFALMVIVVNGVFQEEALFSPLALGAILALNGHVLGSAHRRPPARRTRQTKQVQRRARRPETPDNFPHEMTPVIPGAETQEEPRVPSASDLVERPDAEALVESEMQPPGTDQEREDESSSSDTAESLDPILNVQPEQGDLPTNATPESKEQDVSLALLADADTEVETAPASHASAIKQQAEASELASEPDTEPQTERKTEPKIKIDKEKASDENSPETS